MNKKEQALLQKAVKYDYDKPIEIKGFYLLNTHKLYKGFWGKNGYNNIKVIGIGENGELYSLNEAKECDIFRMCFYKHGSINVDIDNEYDTIRIMPHKPIVLKSGGLSSFIVDYDLWEN